MAFFHTSPQKRAFPRVSIHPSFFFFFLVGQRRLNRATYPKKIFKRVKKFFNFEVIRNLDTEFTGRKFKKKERKKEKKGDFEMKNINLLLYKVEEKWKIWESFCWGVGELALKLMGRIVPEQIPTEIRKCIFRIKSTNPRNYRIRKSFSIWFSTRRYPGKRTHFHEEG